MKFVWIVEAGERGQGGTVRGVYADRPPSGVIKSLSTAHSAEGWRYVGGSRWTCAGDWLTVRKYRVRP